MRFRTPVLTLGLFIAGAPISGAQPAGAAVHVHKQSDQSVVNTITDAEKRWVSALVKNDVGTLDAILAPGYSDTDEEGNRTNKQDILAAIRSGDVKFGSISITEVHVQQYGSAAIATGVAVQKGAYKGQPFAPKIAFIDTFVRENGAWRAVASQRTAVH